MTERVAVLGGGVAGLTAAHELAERGFEVTVYEARAAARRQGAQPAGAGLGHGGRADLPAEHGFRFFPGFYKHVPDTMRRHRRRCRHLVGAERVLLAQGEGAQRADRAAHLPESLEDFARGGALRVRGGDEARRPAAGHGVVRGPAADAADELRRAAARGVGAPELVGLRATPTGARPRSASSSPTGSRARWWPPGRTR